MRAVLDHPSSHPFPKLRRQRPRAGDDALRVIGRHVDANGTWGGRRAGLLYVDERELILAIARNVDVRRIAQLPKRAAAFHPVGGVDQLDLGAFGPLLEVEDQLLDSRRIKKGADRPSFVFAQLPERLAERDRGTNVAETPGREMMPFAAHCLGERLQPCSAPSRLGLVEGGPVSDTGGITHARPPKPSVPIRFPRPGSFTNTAAGSKYASLSSVRTGQGLR